MSYRHHHDSSMAMNGVKSQKSKNRPTREDASPQLGSPRSGIDRRTASRGPSALLLQKLLRLDILSLIPTELTYDKNLRLSTSLWIFSIAGWNAPADVEASERSSVTRRSAAFAADTTESGIRVVRSRESQ